MALISKNYPMNVSPNWLKQIDIAENGTTEQKIALAGSDEILDSIQYLLVSDSDIQVKIAMSKNPKLTELSTRLLSNQSIDDEIERIKDEEMLRTIYITPNAPSSATTSLWVEELKEDFNFQIVQNPNLSESMILDILDMDNLHNANQYGSDLYYADSIVRKILGMSNHTTYRYDHGTWSMKRSDIRSDIKYRYSNISKDVWIKIIDLTMTLKHIKSAELLSWEKNPWTFADHVIYLLSLNNFVHVDVEAQIYMAEKLVQLYQDIETDPELSSVTYGYTFEEYEEATGLSALFSSSYISRGGRTDMPFYQVVRLTLKNIQQNQNFNIVAKTILSQISL